MRRVAPVNLPLSHPLDGEAIRAGLPTRPTPFTLPDLVK